MQRFKYRKFLSDLFLFSLLGFNINFIGTNLLLYFNDKIIELDSVKRILINIETVKEKNFSNYKVLTLEIIALIMLFSSFYYLYNKILKAKKLNNSNKANNQKNRGSLDIEEFQLMLQDTLLFRQLNRFKLGIWLYFSYSVVIYNTEKLVKTITIIVFIEIILLKKKERQLEYSKMLKSEIYKTRKIKLDFFIKKLYDKTKKMILVDGEWGVGKSFFVDEALKSEAFIDFHKIYVDILLFSDKEQMMNTVFNEINKALISEGVRSSSIKKYKKIIDVATEKFPLQISSLIGEETILDVEENLKADIRKLKNQIIIIVDNLERLVDKDKTVDILGFLHKLNKTLNYNTKVIVVAKSSELLKNNEYSEYLQKFFDEKIYIHGEETTVILANYISEISEHEEKITAFSNVFGDLDNLYNYVAFFMEIEENFKNYCLEKFRTLKNKASNSRNIKVLIDDYVKNLKLYPPIYIEKNDFNLEIYKKQILYFTIFKEFLPFEYSEILGEVNYDFFDDSKEMDVQEKYSYEFSKIYFNKISFYKSVDNSTKEVMKRAWLRLFNNIGEDREEEIILNLKFFLDDSSNNICDFTFVYGNLIDSITLLNKKELNFKVYKKILTIYQKEIASEIEKDSNFMWNPLFFEFERELMKDRKNMISIFNLMSDRKKMNEEKLVQMYPEFYYFLKKYCNVNIVEKELFEKEASYRKATLNEKYFKEYNKQFFTTDMEALSVENIILNLCSNFKDRIDRKILGAINDMYRLVLFINSNLEKDESYL